MLSTIESIISPIVSKLAGNLKRSFFNIINFIIDSVAILLNSVSIQKKKQVQLGIVKLDVIGDFFIWSYHVNSIINHYKKKPTDKIILIAENSWANLAWQLYPFDEIIEIKRSKFRMNPIYRIQILLKLNQYAFDYLLKPSYTREFSLEESILRVAKANNKIGYLPKYQGNEWRIWERIAESWFDMKIENIKATISEIERNNYFLTSLGIKNKQIQLGSFPIINTPTEDNIKEKYFIIFPGASVGRKKWDSQKYAELINLILANTELICVICGGNSDIIFTDQIIKSIENRSKIINKVGKTTLLDLLTIIKKSDILIGNDTSGIHIAAAVGTKSICILGGGHFGRFLPYPNYLEPREKQPVIVHENMPCFGCGWKCKYSLSYDSAVPCVSNVSVEKVFIAFKHNLTSN